MGVVPIVSAVSAIGSFAQQKSQANAAAAGVAANQQAAQAQAAIQRANLANQQQFASYKAQLEDINRQLQGNQAAAGLQAHNALTLIQQQQQASQLQSQAMLAKMQIADQSNQLSASKTQTAINASAQRSQSNAKYESQQQQLQQATKQADTGLTEGARKLAAYQSMQAAAGISDSSRTSMVNESQMSNDTTLQALGINLATMSAKDQADIQNAFEILRANQQEQLGNTSIDESLRRLQFQSGQVDAGVQFGQQDLATQQQLATLAADTAQKSFNYSNTADTYTSRLNQLYATQGFQMQNNALESQLGSQMATLNAQKASIQSPSALSLLPTLVSAASPYIKLGNTAQPQQQQSNYSFYSGVTLPPMTAMNNSNIYSGSFLTQ